MKKKFLILTISMVLGIVLGVFIVHAVYQLTYDKESATIEYLENKYNQSFIIISEVESIEDDYVYAYNVSSDSNSNVVFTAGQKKEKNIFPFLPPLKNKVFFDDYFEQSKSYTISSILMQDTFVLCDENDINSLVDTIYTYMEEINLQLSELGFSTTKYTCSIEVSVLVNNREEAVSFYILDKAKIYDQLAELYY